MNTQTDRAIPIEHSNQSLYDGFESNVLGHGVGSSHGSGRVLNTSLLYLILQILEFGSSE